MKGAGWRVGQAATLLAAAALLPALTACGQKGGLYMPDNPPASSRHKGQSSDAAKQAASAPASPATAPSATITPPDTQP